MGGKQLTWLGLLTSPKKWRKDTGRRESGKKWRTGWRWDAVSANYIELQKMGEGLSPLQIG
jgi:hypothetical protein